MLEIVTELVREALPWVIGALLLGAALVLWWLA